MEPLQPGKNQPIQQLLAYRKQLEKAKGTPKINAIFLGEFLTKAAEEFLDSNRELLQQILANEAKKRGVTLDVEEIWPSKVYDLAKVTLVRYLGTEIFAGLPDGPSGKINDCLSQVTVAPILHTQFQTAFGTKSGDNQKALGTLNAFTGALANLVQMEVAFAKGDKAEVTAIAQRFKGLPGASRGAALDATATEVGMGPDALQGLLRAFIERVNKPS